MEFKNARYRKDYNFDGDKNPYMSISVEVGDKFISVPCIVGNRYYDEIMKQVKEGTLTIKDAD